MPQSCQELLSLCIVLALGSLRACTHKAESSVHSVAYFRGHPAEGREQRVWICTNDPGTFDPTSECTTALLALRDPQNSVGASNDTARAARSPMRR